MGRCFVEQMGSSAGAFGPVTRGKRLIDPEAGRSTARRKPRNGDAAGPVYSRKDDVFIAKYPWEGYSINVVISLDS